MNTPVSPTTLTLTEGQQKAFDATCQFLLDPSEHIFVLKGFAGVGKSTLTKYLVEKIPDLARMRKLIDPTFKGWEIQMTATTNKACEALRALCGGEVRTIQSFLGLRVAKDYKTGKTHLVPKSNSEAKTGMVIFIDEFSLIDARTLKLILEGTVGCKLIFMGDPAQLTQHDSPGMPVVTSGYPTVEMTEVVRQAEGNPIIELATAFRETVRTGKFFSFTPDGDVIRWMDREAWATTIRQEFTRPDWSYQDSKVLSWTNRRVIEYNHAIRDMAKGDPDFQVGDYAIVNQYMADKAMPLKTDQMVEITNKSSIVSDEGVYGWEIELNWVRDVFLPQSLQARKALVSKARTEENYALLQYIDNTWIDLRAAYACTINKSQGSTYDTVFIDLDDIRACNNPNQIARMLYVAVSRARHKVIFAGDLV